MNLSIAHHESKFNHFISLIPQKYYLPMETDSISHKYMHNKKQLAPKQEIKEATKKAKKLKLEPKESLNNDEIKNDLASVELESPSLQVEFTPMPHMSSIVELKSKLQSKLNELKSKRSNGNSKESTPKSRQEILEKRRLKRKVKSSTTNQRSVSTSGNSSGNSSMTLLKKESSNPIKFSQIQEFQKEGEFKRKRGDTSSLLHSALQKKQKLQELESKDASKAQEIKEKSVWSKMEALASGVKVKDDVQLLKKTLKKKESLKKKSSKEWKNREESVSLNKLQRQQKRQENLLARKESKKKPKGKKRPGFEGKK